MNLVDVHILRLPNDREDWFQYCLDSLEREPVNLHILDGVEGNIGAARIKGFSHGTAPYAAYVDPDDLVCRGAFQACIDALEADSTKVLAYTREARISEGGCLISEWDRKLYEPFFGKPEEALRAHHLSVYRRSALPDLSFLNEYITVPEMALKKAMWNNNFAFVDRVGYQWRQHNNNASKKIPPNTQCMQDIVIAHGSLWRFVV